MTLTPINAVEKEQGLSGFNYVKFASDFFRPYIQSYLVNFSELKVAMKKGDINMSLEEYISVAILTSIVVFFCMSLSLSVIILIITSNIFMSIFLSILGAIFFSALIFGFFYIYPGIRRDDRKKKIDGLVPYATLYLTTISGGGTPPIAMFRALAKFNEYGEISKEANKIVEEVDVLGIDILNALKNAAERTPSQQLMELLWGMRTVEISGGDLRFYLREKAKTAISQYQMMLKVLQHKLSMIVEIYLTVVMIGSILYMVLTAIMGSMGGADMAGFIVGSQMVVVFLAIPVVSAGVILLIKGITPETN
ncbi:MAG: type II secretion system F family protein [DPANN group archaeon]|nr:type II secretion system F family protein [DPANN group archaeon]